MIVYHFERVQYAHVVLVQDCGSLETLSLEEVFTPYHFWHAPVDAI